VIVHPDAAEAAGIDPDKLTKAVKRLERAAVDLQRMGCKVFGGMGGADVRTSDNLIVATLDGGSWDGGDGGHSTEHSGLLYGERCP